MTAPSSSPMPDPAFPRPMGAPAVMSAPLTPHAPILVATDGSGPATSALVVAKLLAPTLADVQVVSVLDPLAVVMPPGEMPMRAVEVDEARLHAQRGRLRWQLEGIFGDTVPSLDVVLGNPIERVAAIARERRAGMIVTGLRHHGRLDRMMLHRETPLAIAERSRLPVLIVPQGMMRLPRVALVAVDVDDASVHAARCARSLFADAELVYVVHVRARSVALPTETLSDWERALSERTQETFDRVIAALALKSSARVETRVLSGHPVDELLDFAAHAQVELIVAGHHRRGFIDRATGAHSVAERVFRGTACAMLLVPHLAGVELPAAMSAEVEVFADRTQWALPAAAFTYRNVGRTARVEVDSRGAAGVGQVDGYPFHALEHDAASGRLRIVLGADDERTPRISCEVPAAESLEVRRRREGKDLALRVAHGDGYTLLTFDE